MKIQSKDFFPAESTILDEPSFKTFDLNETFNSQLQSHYNSEN